MIPFLDLKRQHYSIKPEIDAAIQRVLESGSFILGKELEAFEKEFAHYCNARYAIGVANGTEAIQLSLIASGIKQGDEVITVANTASATVAAIVAAGAKPVFVDIDAESFTINTELIEKKISKRTRAILPVHLFGQSADLKPILEIAEKNALTVIEDACQAHGAEYNGKKVGAIGALGCFSFYPTKNLGCYGDGGIVTTNNAELAEKIRLLRNYGWKEKYSSEINGFNSRLDELQAAILQAKLKHLDEWNEKRRAIAKRYEKIAGVVPPVEKKYARHIYHLFVIKSSERDKLQEFLQKKGIATLIHYPAPVHLQKAFSNLGFLEGSLPETENCARKILSLPLFPELKKEEIEFVCSKITEFKPGTR